MQCQQIAITISSSSCAFLSAAVGCSTSKQSAISAEKQTPIYIASPDLEASSISMYVYTEVQKSAFVNYNCFCFFFFLLHCMCVYCFSIFLFLCCACCCTLFSLWLVVFPIDGFVFAPYGRLACTARLPICIICCALCCKSGSMVVELWSCATTARVDECAVARV